MSFIEPGAAQPTTGPCARCGQVAAYGEDHDEPADAATKKPPAAKRKAPEPSADAQELLAGTDFKARRGCRPVITLALRCGRGPVSAHHGLMHSWLRRARCRAPSHGGAVLPVHCDVAATCSLGACVRGAA